MGIWQDLEAQAADRMMNTGIVVCQSLGVEDMISIQSVCEVVLGEVCTVPVISSNAREAYFQGYLPRNDDFIVNTVQLHMLQAPALVDTLRNPFLLQTGQIGGVEHPNLNPL